MSSYEDQQFAALKSLAQRRYDMHLSIGEERVLYMSTRQIIDFAAPQNAALKQVRPGFVRWLIEDQDVGSYIDHSGFNIYSAIFDEDVHLEKCVVSSPLGFGNCRFNASLDLSYASIRMLILDRSTLVSGLMAVGLETNGPVVCTEVVANGHVSFTGATIRGNLMLSQVSLRTSEVSLDFSQASVHGLLQLAPEFIAEGEVELIGTTITNGLNLRNAKIASPNNAISAKRLIVGGDLDLSGCELKAPAWFENAVVGGDCLFDGVRMTTNTDSYAIAVRWSEITGNLSFSDLFETNGSISLQNTQVGKSVAFYRCSLDSLVATGLRVKGDLVWRAVQLNPSNGLLMLEDAELHCLRDDSSSWPARGFLRIRRASLGRIIQHVNVTTEQGAHLPSYPSEILLTAGSRLKWLEKQDNESALDPGCWFDLARSLRSKGDMSGARQVIYAYRKRQAFGELALGWPEPFSLFPWTYGSLIWAHQWVTVFWLACRWLLRRVLAVFEREPLLVVANLLVMTLLATSLFYPLRAKFSPTEQSAYQEAFGVRHSASLLPPYPKFSPFVYSH